MSSEELFNKFKDNDIMGYTSNVYEQGCIDTTYKILNYLNDVRFNEDTGAYGSGCYECISDLMENIEKVGVKND